MRKKIHISYILFQVLLLVFLTAIQACASSPTREADKPQHHTTDGFRNFPSVEKAEASLGFRFYWRRFMASFKTPEIPDSHVIPQESALRLYNKLQPENTITWIGQSTLLIKVGGKIILTDPFFSAYASPLPMGPRRYVDPGISAAYLPKIDMILISHNHYDHLDAKFLKSLANKETIQVCVPLGLRKFFGDLGYSQVFELDWYDTQSINGFRLTALPTVHYSGRGMVDKNRSLWCSWAISHPSGDYFFIGDSAYSPTLFKEIGTKFQSFDLAMLTIGTYGNRKYGVNNHTNPEEAVQIGREINARALMGIHWGTIDLSEEDPWEPPVRFESAAQKAGYRPQDAWVMKIGETRILPGN